MNSDLEQKQNLLTQATLFKLLGDTNRLRIIRIISYEPTSVSEICCELDLEQSLVSHHLSNLRKFDIVSSQRNNKQIIYSIKKDLLSEALELLDQMLERIETEATNEQIQREQHLIHIKSHQKEIENKQNEKNIPENDDEETDDEEKVKEYEEDNEYEFSKKQYDFKKIF